MVTFKKGKLTLHLRDGKTQEVDAILASNGLAISPGGGSWRSKSIHVYHIKSGFLLGGESGVYSNKADAERFIREVDGVTDFHKERPSMDAEQKKAFRAAIVRADPDRKTTAEKKAEEEAKRKADAEKDKAARKGKENFGHYPYKGSTEPHGLNSYSVHALNRKKAEIAYATAEGSKARNRAKKQIYHDKDTWLKFETYNRTRGKFLKNRRYN